MTTLCGSTRFPDAFDLANMHLSMMGRLVISVGLKGHADEPRGARFLTSDGDESTPEKQGLDTLHYRKIDLADGIYVVNVGGYVGSSTRREIAYAREQGKTVEWMFPDAVPQDLVLAVERLPKEPVCYADGQNVEPGDRVRIVGEIISAEGTVVRIRNGYPEVWPDGHQEDEPFDANRLVLLERGDRAA